MTALTLPSISSAATDAAPESAGDTSNFTSESAIALVEAAQAKRIDLIQRVSPSVVCIFDEGREAGGSGVLIDEQGLGLTNYHVVGGMMGERRGWGGLSNGELYRLQVLGIDPTGDVAMFRLVGRDEFPHAKIGDSDRVSLGDPVLALGNPFSLSEDYSPTVTQGLVTGVHRYQWGVRGNLIYSDCIQTDASINPGNSGGPLFNSTGEVIGINGRISVNTRGRFNVGFGYAIASNQIKRFIPALRAGLLAKHGTLQALTVPADDGRAMFDEILREGPAYRAGVRPGDVLLAIDDTAIDSPNHYASVLGTYPGDWHVRLRIDRYGDIQDLIVRLDAITPNLSRPFTVDREVNLLEVERVLAKLDRRHENAPVGRAMKWACTVVRRKLTCKAGDAESKTRFAVSQTGDSPIRMTKLFEDGRTGRHIEYDDRKAVQRASDEAEPFALPANLTMVYGALYVVQKKLTLPYTALDLTEVKHGGADSRVRLANLQDRSLERQRPQQPLAILEWPVAEHAEARLAVDVEARIVRYIDIRDIPSGSVATIELAGYRDFKDFVQPCNIKVTGPGFAWEDTITDWRFED